MFSTAHELLNNHTERKSLQCFAPFHQSTVMEGAFWRLERVTEDLWIVHGPCKRPLAIFYTLSASCPLLDGCQLSQHKNWIRHASIDRRVRVLQILRRPAWTIPIFAGLSLRVLAAGSLTIRSISLLHAGVLDAHLHAWQRWEGAPPAFAVRSAHNMPSKISVSTCFTSWTRLHLQEGLRAMHAALQACTRRQEAAGDEVA